MVEDGIARGGCKAVDPLLGTYLIVGPVITPSLSREMTGCFPDRDWLDLGTRLGISFAGLVLSLLPGAREI